MTPDKRNRLSGGTEAVERVQADGLLSTTSLNDSSSFLKRSIPRAADDVIERAGWALRAGRLDVWQLPRGLAAFYYLAHLEGEESVKPELARALEDAERLYRIAFWPADHRNPGVPYVDLERKREALYEQRHREWLEQLVDGIGGITR